MNGYSRMVEDDEAFGEAYDDEYFVESDDEASDDEFSERRGRRGGASGRRPPNIRVPKTGTGRNFVRQPASKEPVTTASMQASLERVGADIRANAAAIKELGAQLKSATANLTAVNNKQDAAIADLRSDFKKAGSAASQSNQMNMLLPLLQKNPELESTGVGDTALAGNVLTSVRVKKQDTTLPLIIMMMGYMQPGASGGNSNQMGNMMLPMLLMLDK
jgi:hypothetical protein